MIKDPVARIEKKTVWGDYCLLSVRSPGIAGDAEPGQFLMVKTTPHPFPLLRRPFSIHRADSETVSIFFQRCGTGTAALADKATGDRLDLIGPLGKGFRLESLNPVRPVGLIGGGRGIAPLFFLAERLKKLEIPLFVYYGGRTAADLPLKVIFESSGFEIQVSTDDGSLGHQGLVTELAEFDLGKRKIDSLFACGPDPMLLRVAQWARERNIPAQLSLESHMGCGFGACWGCVKKIRTPEKTEWIKICTEGPVFSSEAIVWEEEPR